MKIFHLASFSGNIGDVANHESFYYQLQQRINETLEISKVEIRDFYQSVDIRSFDDDFVSEVNQHDLFIIGGGNFFELCWDYSETGTTFNITKKRLLDIKVPIWINGIGVDDNKGVSTANVEKFRMFLKTLFDKKSVFFTVRNDGSFDIFKKYYPEYLDKVLEVPDFGFYINENLELAQYSNERKVRSIGINIALDMPSIRYSTLDYNEYLQIIANQIDRIISETDYHLYLFAHIISDYKAIIDLVERLESRQARTRLSISSLMIDKELDTFKCYKECDYILATRFHSNVCAISLGVPTFGIVSYPKHEIVYDKINLQNRKCNINNYDFIDRLGEEIDNILTDEQYIYRLKLKYTQVRNSLDKEKEELFNKVIQWLIDNKIASESSINLERSM